MYLYTLIIILLFVTCILSQKGLNAMTDVKNIFCRICGRYMASGGIEIESDNELVKLCCGHCVEKFRQQKRRIQER